VADTPSAGRRRVWVIVAAAVVVAFVALGLVFLPTGSGQKAKPGRGSAARALAHLDANHGESYVGSIGDATDPAKLRRALRAEFRSRGASADGHGASAARRCATQLRRTDGASRSQVVLLADATLSGAPVVVVGVTDHGRVVAFVADADTCAVRMAQSL
jgi:hypothetical protein